MSEEDKKIEIDTTRRNFIKLSVFSVAAFILGKISAPSLTLNGNSGNSNLAQVGVVGPPTTPTGLVATPVSSSQVNLSWTPSTDNTGVANYKVYRQLGLPTTPPPLPVGSISIIYEASYPTPTLTDTFVVPNKTAKLNYGKHTKMAYCPLNGDLYLCGGDGQGQHWGGNGSGTMDTVGRYSVATHTYAEDFLYRGHVGEPVPRGLDFIAFTWAPSLNEFWLGPGFAWNNTTANYPWLDTSWKTSNYASYNPITRRFTDRGLKGAAFNEGFAGSWDTKRNRLVFVYGQRFYSVDPATNQATSISLTISTHRAEMADTWYDADTDELYFVQLANGKIYAYQIGTSTLRLVAATGVVSDNGSSFAAVFITDDKYCLITYPVVYGGALPWKLVNLTTGEIQHLNHYLTGQTYYNIGAYHPPSKTIVLTGGSSGSAYHHYRVVSSQQPPSPPPPLPFAPTATLTSSASSVTSGGSATLTWSSTNATTCTASGGWTGTKAISGSQSTGALTSTKTFTLTCSGAGGNITQNVTVTVTGVILPPPPPPPPPPAGTLPTWIPAPGSVAAIPSLNTMKDVMYLTSAGSTSGNGNGYFGAWCSGVYAPNDGIYGSMSFSNGGDGDYWGNEVYKFSIGTAKWSRECERSTGLLGGGSADPNFDASWGEHISPGGTPPPQPGVPHSYDQMEYLPPHLGGGPKGSFMFCTRTIVYGVLKFRHPHIFDLTTKAWRRGSATPNIVAFGSNDSPTWCFDSSRNRFWGLMGGQSGINNIAIRHLDFNSATGLAISGGVAIPNFITPYGYPTSRYWPTGDLMLVIGRSAIGAGVYEFVLNATPLATTGTSGFTTITLSGSTIPVSSGYGFAYCSDLDCFFVRAAGAASSQKIWKITPPTSNYLTAAWTVEEITMSGDTASYNSQGMWKRFMYVPSLKCLMWVDSISGPVYAYRVAT